MMTASTAMTAQSEKPALNISGDYLSTERATNTLKSANVDAVEKSGSGFDEEDDQLLGIHVHGLGPGTAPEHVYEANMAWWRAGMRRFLVKNLHAESRWIAAMQKRIRTPWLDTYFVYTSSLGTHTFFMTLLPALFFFGYNDLGRGIVHVLALGVYLSSLVKDLICAPRPFAPPVTRLTMGTHHLEYGFPSTHSTNSISIALYLYALLWRGFYPSSSSSSAISSSATTFIWSFLNTLISPFSSSSPSTLLSDSISTNSTTAAASAVNATVSALVNNTVINTAFEQYEDASGTLLAPGVFYLSSLLLVIYAFSIVFGRLYCAMHSFTDCVMGIALGSGIFAVQWVYGASFDRWNATPGWAVPLVIVPLGTFLVNQHAEPVDDCPCFEDAIAFVSVIIGTTLAMWHGAHVGYGYGAPGYFVSRTPGWEGRDLRDWMVWCGFAGLKTVVGVAIIFSWRLLAKPTLHTLLPPLFRGLARLFTLPHRRFYTPATDYKGPVPEGEGGLRPIPSVIDLPKMMELDGLSKGVSTSVLPRYAMGARARNGLNGNGGGSGGLQMKGRGGAGAGAGKSLYLSPPLTPPDEAHYVDGNGHGHGHGHGNSLGGVTYSSGGTGGGDEKRERARSPPAAAVKDNVRHYDADVITKVVVYAGIGFLASGLIPVLFEMLGWGVLPVSGR